MKLNKLLKLGALTATAALTTACTLPGLGATTEEDSVVVATQTSTEMVILGYLVEGMLEHYTDLNVDVIQNLGSSFMVNNSLVTGDADIAGVRYTGTSLTGELGQDPITEPDEAFEVVVEEFEEQYNQKFYPSYGFFNTYAFLVTQELAEEEGIEAVSDLEDIADDVVAGVDNAWMDREGDGYAAFTDAYGFEFDTVYPMEIGLVYDAVESGDMEVVLGYSTDGRISSYDLVVLEDDLNFFPPYDASPGATYEILEEHPIIDDVLYKLVDVIDTELMQELNFTSDEYLIEPATVAYELLEANDYFYDNGPQLEPVEEE